ncbi:MAG: DUF1043 family protein [Pantoea sp. Brub]|nr:DUF1043 family protein [Pantoea sp. Brub]
MAWLYGLIGLTIGFILGISSTRYLSKNIRKQQHLRLELEKTKTELLNYQKEIQEYLSQSINLLDKMVYNYRNLHQHISKRSENILKDNYYYQNFEQNTNEPLSVQAPLDYSDNASSLLSRKYNNQY